MLYCLCMFVISQISILFRISVNCIDPQICVCDQCAWREDYHELKGLLDEVKVAGNYSDISKMPLDSIKLVSLMRNGDIDEHNSAQLCSTF
jgi:hypothetical protein